MNWVLTVFIKVKLMVAISQRGKKLERFHYICTKHNVTWYYLKEEIQYLKIYIVDPTTAIKNALIGEIKSNHKNVQLKQEKAEKEEKKIKNTPFRKQQSDGIF